MNRTLAIVLTLGVALASGVAAQKPSSPEAQLGAIIHQAEAEREFQDAIPLYHKFIAENGSNKPLAAKAQYHLAVAFEELGYRVEARKAFERVTTVFADQGALAADARKRLAGFPLEISDRSVCVGCGATNHPVGAVSWDGRMMVFNGDGGLSVRELSSGKVTLLQPGRVMSPVLSRDGKKIVYTADTGATGGVAAPILLTNPLTNNPETALGREVISMSALIRPGQYELRVVDNVEGATPRTLNKNPEFLTVIPAAWSPDGSSILAVVHKRVDETWMIAWISATDGKVTQLKSLGWRFKNGALGLPSISADGRSVAYAAKVTDERPALSGVLDFLSDPQGIHIYVLPADPKSSMPERELVDGASINESPVWAPDGKSLLFLSDRTGDFGLWTVSLADRSLRQVRPNTGEIRNLGVTDRGTYFYARPHTITESSFELSRLDNAPHTAALEPRTIAGTFLAWSPDARSFAYAKPTYRAEQTAKVSGLFVYSLDSKTERRYVPPLGLSVAQGVPGGTQWFHNGKSLLRFMENDKGELSLYQVDLDSAELRLLAPAIKSVPVAISSDDKTVYFASPAETAAPLSQTDTLRAPTTAQTSPELPSILKELFVVSCQRQRIIQMDVVSRRQKEIAVIPQPSTLALSPDGKTLYASACGSRMRNPGARTATSSISVGRWDEMPTTQSDAEIIALDTTENGRHRSIAFSTPIAPGFALSRDGRTLAAVTSSQKLVRIGVDGTGLQELYAPESGHRVASPLWSRTGTDILFQVTKAGSREPSLVRVAANGGKTEVVLPESPDLEQNAFVSPDHSHVITPAVAGGHEVRAIDNVFSSVKPLR